MSESESESQLVVCSGLAGQWSVLLRPDYRHRQSGGACLHDVRQGRQNRGDDHHREPTAVCRRKRPPANTLHVLLCSAKDFLLTTSGPDGQAEDKEDGEEEEGQVRAHSKPSESPLSFLTAAQYDDNQRPNGKCEGVAHHRNRHLARILARSAENGGPGDAAVAALVVVGRLHLPSAHVFGSVVVHPVILQSEVGGHRAVEIVVVNLGESPGCMRSTLQGPEDEGEDG
mmetsp:Transcript_20223/g.40821  ORF Transcript_20223/g.40821 Transcript_20223/m.40821 type:complete len:228 (+) Transcript_20223:1207-1890(+)